jgi:hypothetical protein
MLFTMNGSSVETNNILQDDTIRDVALKLTNGRGGVYLYGKVETNASLLTVWQKYNRPLTSWELVAELNNVGIRRKVHEGASFEFEDLSDFFPPKCVWEYVALGQHLPLGVRVKPPTQSYSLAEYQNKTATLQDKKRLFEYENLTEVHAVTITHLRHVYLPHSAGIVPEDSMLRAAVSTWVWNIAQEIYILPTNHTNVDLPRLFSRVHATELVPHISYGKIVRSFDGSPIELNEEAEAVTFHLKRKGAYVSFFADGSMKCVKTDASETNPIVHYTNQVVVWATAFDSDAVLIGQKLAFTPLFSDAVYPLWRANTKERTTIATAFSGEVPSLTKWHAVIAPTMEYARCRPTAKLVFRNGNVRVTNIPTECLSYASRYVEGWLTSTSDPETDEVCSLAEVNDIQEDPTVDVCDAYLSKFADAGYEMGMRYKGGILAMDKKGNYGFLPCPPTSGPNPFLKEWVPSLGYKETIEFLETAARIQPRTTPKECVLNHKGCCVGVLTQDNMFVRCEPERWNEDTHRLRKTTEHEILFPKTGIVYGVFRELIREYGMKSDMTKHIVCVDERTDEFPQWRENKLIVTFKEKAKFASMLVNDMARYQHLRCYMTKQTQDVDGFVLDVWNDEQIIVL